MEGNGLDLRGLDHPELVIGLVGALGTPLARVVSMIQAELESAGYTSEEIRLSQKLEAYELPTDHPSSSASDRTRWEALMDRGNELREALGRGDALAMHAAADIRARRPSGGSGTLERTGFVLNQLKHPDEVRLLRRVYGDAFHLVGVFTPEAKRSEYLRNIKNLSEVDATALLERDAGEEVKLGQQVTKTFHLADLFVELLNWSDSDVASARAQVHRYFDLLFGREIITPTREEYGMFMAHSAALRSADLSRQVGAAIVTPEDEVIGLGANEVPKAGGGQYWEHHRDGRDVDRGFDSNEKIKRECVEEVAEKLVPEFGDLSPDDRDVHLKKALSDLKGTRLMNLTEFGRAVHAEMEAILSAARVGVSVRGSRLFTTTFPCHNCAKHIVGAGVASVVYVEPYPKSLADRLHDDSIAFISGSEDTSGGKVTFSPFSGVAPRRFRKLFSAVADDGEKRPRKEKGGAVQVGATALRLFSSPLSYIEREALVARYLQEFIEELMNTDLGESTNG